MGYGRKSTLFSQRAPNGARSLISIMNDCFVIGSRIATYIASLVSL